MISMFENDGRCYPYGCDLKLLLDLCLVSNFLEYALLRPEAAALSLVSFKLLEHA